MPSITCAHCHNTHYSVADVRACAGVPARPIVATPAPAAKPVAPAFPAGHYALTDAAGVIKFYKIDKPTKGKWKGYTFVKVQASDDLYPIRNRAARDAIIADIAADPMAALKLYADQLGCCGICNRTLTDATSRSIGIGPVCRNKMGI